MFYLTYHLLHFIFEYFYPFVNGGGPEIDLVRFNMWVLFYVNQLIDQIQTESISVIYQKCSVASWDTKPGVVLFNLTIENKPGDSFETISLKTYLAQSVLTRLAF